MPHATNLTLYNLLNAMMAYVKLWALYYTVNSENIMFALCLYIHIRRNYMLQAYIMQFTDSAGTLYYTADCEYWPQPPLAEFWNFVIGFRKCKFNNNFAMLYTRDKLCAQRSVYSNIQIHCKQILRFFIL